MTSVTKKVMQIRQKIEKVFENVFEELRTLRDSNAVDKRENSTFKLNFKELTPSKRLQPL